MLKPGQLFTSNKNTYQVTKGTFKSTLGKREFIDACQNCKLHYGVHLNTKVPCLTHKDFPCTKYCGLHYYPKLVKLCGNQDN